VGWLEVALIPVMTSAFLLACWLFVAGLMVARRVAFCSTNLGWLGGVLCVELCGM